MSRLETGFRDVDAAGDAESYADYLSHVNGLESVAAGKRERARLLGLRAGSNEPDWGTLASTGRPRELVRAMLDVAEEQIRNPWIGRELAGLFVDAGLTDVTVQAEVLLVRDFYPDVIIDLPLLAADLRAQGHEGVEDLLTAAEDDTRVGRTVAALTLFTVFARR